MKRKYTSTVEFVLILNLSKRYFVFHSLTKRFSSKEHCNQRHRIGTCLFKTRIYRPSDTCRRSLRHYFLVKYISEPTPFSRNWSIGAEQIMRNVFCRVPAAGRLFHSCSYIPADYDRALPHCARSGTLLIQSARETPEINETAYKENSWPGFDKV